MRASACLVFTIALILTSFGVSAVVSSQASQKDDETWTKWTRKEAEKILSESPWSGNQTETDTSEMFFSPTADPNKPGARPQPNDKTRLEQGATNQSVNVKYVLRFFSARPVRRALVRLMELQSTPSAEQVQKLHNFANVKATDSIIITLVAQSTDQRSEREVMQAINSAVTGTLKNETYLERNGKRLFLEEYIPPGRDGFGARFIFLRMMDERPFIDDKTGEVRFVAKFEKGPQIDKRFKVSEMVYNGELEY
ncbi:MAG: hypothetical protein DMF69_09555 [Acidobacteria bacterium]|nr:MAG: hypothetical protein DMF69_09555 [Acidobacteriota bacterium]